MPDDQAQADSKQQDSSSKAGGDSKTFTQEDLNNIVAREVKKVKESYGDYSELRKFKEEQERAAQEREQQNLEQKQEYDKLKQGWQSKEQEYQQKLNEAKNLLNSERINNALTNEVMKQNAFPEAAKLVRELAKLTDDGKVVIHGKNDQGIESDLSVEDGVKQFLKDRPYLVKANIRGGANTSGAGESGGNGSAGSHTSSLYDQWMNARNSGDMLKAKQLKEALRKEHSNRNIVA